MMLAAIKVFFQIPQRQAHRRRPTMRAVARSFDLGAAAE
jgi:hypothetical protein